MKRLRNAWDRTCKWQSQQTIAFQDNHNKQLSSGSVCEGYVRSNYNNICNEMYLRSSAAAPQKHFYWNYISLSWKHSLIKTYYCRFTVSFPHLPSSIESRWVLRSKEQKVRMGFHKFLSFRNKKLSIVIQDLRIEMEWSSQHWIYLLCPSPM